MPTSKISVDVLVWWKYLLLFLKMGNAVYGISNTEPEHTLVPLPFLHQGYLDQSLRQCSSWRKSSADTGVSTWIIGAEQRRHMPESYVCEISLVWVRRSIIKMEEHHAQKGKYIRKKALSLPPGLGCCPDPPEGSSSIKAWAEQIRYYQRNGIFQCITKPWIRYYLSDNPHLRLIFLTSMSAPVFYKNQNWLLQAEKVLKPFAFENKYQKWMPSLRTHIKASTG